jgi:hypothetical protein
MSTGLSLTSFPVGHRVQSFPKWLGAHVSHRGPLRSTVSRTLSRTLSAVYLSDILLLSLSSIQSVCTGFGRDVLTQTLCCICTSGGTPSNCTVPAEVTIAHMQPTNVRSCSRMVQSSYAGEGREYGPPFRPSSTDGRIHSSHPASCEGHECRTQAGPRFRLLYTCTVLVLWGFNGKKGRSP